MRLTRPSSAWLLVGLQTLLAAAFALHLGQAAAGVGLTSPTWYTTLVALQFGLALVLGFVTLSNHENTALVLVWAAHVICPLLFFTDLTRNPYYTQIVLLNVWIGFAWVAWLWDAWVSGTIHFPRTALDLPLWSFCGVALLSWLASFLTHPASFHPAMFWEGLRNILFLAVNALGVFHIAVMVEEPWRKRFLWTTFLVGFVAAAYGLMQFYGVEQIWSKSLTPFANRPVSTFGNPNFLSSYLMLLIPLLLASLMLGKGDASSLFTFVVMVTLVVGVISTMTRSTWVGTLASVALLPLSPSVRDFMRRHHKRLAVIVLVLGLSVLFWPKSKLGGYANPWQRVMEIKEVKTKGSYGPWHQRLLIWSSCWRMVKDHMVLGKGWGQLELFYPYYQGQALFNPLFRPFRTHANNAHNEVIEVWSQTGFIGMGIYVWLWVVLVWFALRFSQQTAQASPDKSIWVWALACAAIGMFVDNFFGNVSIHFAVPAFLFWWLAGTLFSLTRSEGKAPAQAQAEWYSFSMSDNRTKSAVVLVGLIFMGNAVLNYRKEFQEIYYFSGFKIAKSSPQADLARAQLEEAWRWFPREVNTNYELSNAYARLSQQTAQSGLADLSVTWRKKALWAYMESLRSNSGYDEIFFNLAATQSQAGWFTDDFPNLVLEDPRGMAVNESAKEMRGALYNYTRAVAINPLSQDGYSFLGNVFVQDKAKYLDQSILMFRQAVYFFPRNKDYWLNLAYFQLEAKEDESAYQSVKNAMMVDPFYTLSRKNLRLVLSRLKRSNDPLGQVELSLDQINPLVQARAWPQLRSLAARITEILPESHQGWFLLGNVDTELQKWEDAEKAYLQAIRIEPNNFTVYNNLGLVLRATGREAQARKMYERSLELNPAQPQLQEMLKQSPS